MALFVDLFPTSLADDSSLPKYQNRDNDYNFMENWFNIKNYFFLFLNAAKLNGLSKCIKAGVPVKNGVDSLRPSCRACSIWKCGTSINISSLQGTRRNASKSECKSPSKTRIREEFEEPNAMKTGRPTVTSVDNIIGLSKRLLSPQTGPLVLLQSKYTDLPAFRCKLKQSVHLEIPQIN
jgi:hypothetical protein